MRASLGKSLRRILVLVPGAGQPSWSKALVRHGADPVVALAEVLGVATADIRLRERPELANPQSTSDLSRCSSFGSDMAASGW
jgi:hypothetical protein